MSNYIVDSADLASVAGAIRTKGGTSAQLAFPAGFVSAVEAIPTGGGGDVDVIRIKGVFTVFLYHEAGMPVKYIIDTPALASFSPGFRSGSVSPTFNSEIEEIEVSPNNQTIGIDMGQAQMNMNVVYKLKKVNFNFVPISFFYQALSVTYGATRNPDFESILGLNFSLCGGRNYSIGSNFSGCAALKNVTLKPNSLGQRDLIDQTKNWLEFRDSNLLTDESLISIANGLCATHTSKVQFHATPKARLSSIVGMVSQVTDDSGTYDFFTADANGTVTLTDFITTTKGWTLA